MRKHLSWYLKGFPDAAEIRASINSCLGLDDYQALLDGVRLRLKEMANQEESQ